MASSDPCECDEMLEEDFDLVSQRAVALRKGISVTKMRDGVDFEITEKRMQSGGEYKPAPLSNYQKREGSDSLPVDDFDAYIGMMEAVVAGEGSADNGVWKYRLKEGTGDRVDDGAVLKFHYSLFVEHQDEPIDSTLVRNRVKKITLGASLLLAGLEAGLRTMRVGERADFVLGAAMGFGRLGAPPRIPPSARLRVDVQLLFCGRVDHPIDALTADARRQLTADEVFAYVQDKRETGARFFKAGKPCTAINRYEEACQQLGICKVTTKEQRRQQRVFVCYNRIAALHSADYSMEIRKRLARHLKMAALIDGDNVKVLYYQARVLCDKGDLGAAAEKLSRAQAKASDPMLISLAREIDDKYTGQLALEKQQAQRMFAKPLDVALDARAAAVVPADLPSVSERFEGHVADLFGGVFKSGCSQFSVNPMNYTFAELNFLMGRGAEFGFNFTEVETAGQTSILFERK